MGVKSMITGTCISVFREKYEYSRGACFSGALYLYLPERIVDLNKDSLSLDCIFRKIQSSPRLSLISFAIFRVCRWNARPIRRRTRHLTRALLRALPHSIREQRIRTHSGRRYNLKTLPHSACPPSTIQGRRAETYSTPDPPTAPGTIARPATHRAPS